MPKTRTRPYDTAEYLETEDDMAHYLEAALEDGDPKLVTAALGDIARAHGMTQIARETLRSPGFPGSTTQDSLPAGG